MKQKTMEDAGERAVLAAKNSITEVKHKAFFRHRFANNVPELLRLSQSNVKIGVHSTLRRHGTCLQTADTYLVKAGFEVQALALLVHGPQVPVQGGFVPLRPPALAGRTTALEDVL